MAKLARKQCPHCGKMRPDYLYQSHRIQCYARLIAQRDARQAALYALQRQERLAPCMNF